MNEPFDIEDLWKETRKNPPLPNQMMFDGICFNPQNEDEWPEGFRELLDEVDRREFQQKVWDLLDAREK